MRYQIQQAVNILYEEVEKLDMELVDRFAMWFSHYLANFKYEWDWAKWYILMFLY